MPVTCHHCFELCRHVLSSKLAGTHPPSTYLHIPPFACRPATTNEHHTICSISDPIDYTCPPAIAMPASVVRKSHVCRLFVLSSCGFSRGACRDWSFAVNYLKRLLCRRIVYERSESIYESQIDFWSTFLSRFCNCDFVMYMNYYFLIYWTFILH